MTGRKMMMVAVLLANSVKQAMKAVMSITATAGGTWARGCKWFPIHTANPDSYYQKRSSLFWTREGCFVHIFTFVLISTSPSSELSTTQLH